MEKRAKHFAVGYVLMLGLLSSCMPGKITVDLKKGKVTTHVSKSALVSKVEIKNNQIILKGNYLSSITNFSIQGNPEEFNIVSKSDTQLVASPARSIALKLDDLVNMVIGTAEASAVIPVQISLDVPNARPHDFLQYNGSTWDSASINGLNYKGTWNPASAVDPTSTPQSGDYYIISANGTYTLSGISSWSKGDWVVYADNATGWQKIDNSIATLPLESLTNVQITSVATNQVLAWNGTKWINQTFAAPSEVDPKVGAVTVSKWCRGDGSKVVCDQNAPTLTETDPSVQAFAKSALPNCSAGQVLKSNGTSFSCVTDATGAGAFTGTASRVVVTDGTGALSASSITTTLLGYLTGVTSSIQTQLDSKLNSASYITWDSAGPQTIHSSRLNLSTASAVVGTNASGQLIATGTNTTELGYLVGVSSNIQTQLNAKQATLDKTSQPDVRSVKVYGANTTNYVEVSAPTLSGNLLFQLPNSHGLANQILKTDGAGHLSWTDDISGGGSTFTGSNNIVVTTNGSGALASSSVTTTELGYLSGVTSSVQTQLGAKQATLVSSSDLLGDNVRIYNGSNYVELISPTLSGNVTLTLPAALGMDNQILKTMSTGVLSWVNPTSLTVDWSSVGAERVLAGRVNTGMGTGGKIVVSDSNADLVASSVDASLLSNLTGVSSNIQTQLDAKLASSSFVDWMINGAQTIHPARLGVSTCSAGQVLTFNGATFSCVADLTQPTLTANRVTVTNGSGVLTASSITDTILGYLSGLSSNVQTQLNALAASITAVENVTPSAWSAHNASFTATARGQYMVDTSGGAVTITLPATAALGDTIKIIDATGSFDTNNLTVARNGLNIMGLAENMTVANKNISFELVYYNATHGWRIK